MRYPVFFIEWGYFMWVNQPRFTGADLSLIFFLFRTSVSFPCFLPAPGLVF